MNIQKDLTKAEITVLDWLIRLMTSSSLIQTILKKGFWMIREKEIIWLAILFIAWIFTGIITAYFLGISGLR